MSRTPSLRELEPTHPGELLREDVLPAIGKPKAEIARLLGISRQTLSDILKKGSELYATDRGAVARRQVARR